MTPGLGALFFAYRACGLRPVTLFLLGVRLERLDREDTTGEEFLEDGEGLSVGRGGWLRVGGPGVGGGRRPLPEVGRQVFLAKERLCLRGVGVVRRRCGLVLPLELPGGLRFDFLPLSLAGGLLGGGG